MQRTADCCGNFQNSAVVQVNLEKVTFRGDVHVDDLELRPELFVGGSDDLLVRVRAGK